MSNSSKVTTLETPAPEATAVVESVSKAIAGKSSGHNSEFSGKRTKINIYASEKEHGGDVVEVGHNGVMYLIPRGMVIDLPDEVVGVLRDAITTVTMPAPGGGVIERNVPRYNFQVL